MALLEIIARIDVALDDVELKLATSFNGEHYRLRGFRLRVLKRFAQTICSNNLGSEETLSSLLVTINDHVRRISKESHRTRYVMDSSWSQFVELNTMVYWYSTRGRCCPLDDVLQMMTSILEALLEIRSIVMSPHLISNTRESIEELEEQMSFVKALITLAGKTSVVESLNALFSQAVSFCSKAAYFLFTSEDLKVLVSKVSKLLVEMKLVYATLVIARSNTRFPSMDDNDALIAGKHFLDSLVSFIWHLLRLDKCAVSFENLQELYRGIRSLRDTLKLQPMSNLNVKIKQQIFSAVWDAGSFVCSLHCSKKDIRLKNLLESINAILTKYPQEGQFPTTARIMVDELKASPAQRSNLATSINDEGVVGFQEEGIVAVDQLTRGSMQLQMLAIVGMPGLGKTTFATMIYNSSHVSLHFHIRAWSPVSQVVDRNKVFRDLFNQIDPAKCSKMPEQDLADGLRKSLKGRRYLIFLDDVWDVQVWGCLKESFPDDDVGSRIILTSRQHDVAPPDLMVDGKPHCLYPLNEGESMELLHRKLSHSGNGLLPPISLDLRMKIAEKCRGLPLIIVVLAGLLKSVELEGWDEILSGLSNISSTEQCRSTLELSYRHLPAYLRPCLLYFGALGKDRVVSVRRLVRLWIAEGFVQGDELKSLEDVAEDYLNDLIGRSLIMVGKQRTLGGVKAWKIHDLIHDFCQQKAKDEHFFHFLKGHGEISAYNDDVHYLPRLCIDSKVKHFRQSRFFAPRARSLIFNSSQATNFSEENKGWLYIPPAIKISKLLKVLDLEQVHFGLRFPGEIKQLVQLTFLAIQGNVLEIPEWIGNLSSLETFVFVGESICQLPKSLWKLRKLQYLYMGMRSYCYLPEGNPDSSSSSLCKLDRISGVIIQYGKMESTVRMFPNISKLRCTLRWEKDDCNDLVVPNILSRIESLNVLYQGPFSMFNRVSFPENLKKLTLKRFSLSWRNISTIGELPNLEVLKLLWTTFEGETWEMKQGEFSKLRFLKLGSSKLVRWRADCDEDQLGCLRKLVLTECSNLEEMPYCLDNTLTFEIIEVSRCRSTTVDLVKQIEERRRELMGDSGLKIITNNIWD